MKEIHLEIITPSKIAFTGEVKSVTIPGTLGSFQVLYNHAPLLSSLEVGRIKIVDKDGNEKNYATGGGTVEVRNNKVLVLAESFESPEDIIVDRAKQALERAKGRLSDRSNKELDFDRAQAALSRAMNRLNVAGKFASA
jgi:F-type H+-transporting ATPase subunit epsilon